MRSLLRAAQRLAAVALLGALIAAPEAAGAQPTPEVEVGMAPQEITVGDPVVVELSVTPPAGSQSPVFPDWSTERWGRAEILEVGEVQQYPAGPGLTRHSQRLLLTAFEIGEIELPSVVVEMPHATGPSQFASSGPRVLRVESVLPAGDTSEAALEPRPPAGLRSLPAGRAFWWVLAILGLLGAALTAILLRADPSGEHAAPRLDPLDEFDQLVRELGAEPDAVAFHTRLSFALRRFLGRTLGFGAVESTTTEIQARLRQHHLATDTVRHASQLLRDCDQVKFARILAGRRDAAETLGDAGRLARNVYRDVRPEDSDPARGAKQHGAQP